MNDEQGHNGSPPVNSSGELDLNPAFGGGMKLQTVLQVAQVTFTYNETIQVLGKHGKVSFYRPFYLFVTCFGKMEDLKEKGVPQIIAEAIRGLVFKATTVPEFVETLNIEEETQNILRMFFGQHPFPITSVDFRVFRDGFYIGQTTKFVIPGNVGTY